MDLSIISWAFDSNIVATAEDMTNSGSEVICRLHERSADHDVSATQAVLVFIWLKAPSSASAASLDDAGF